MQEREAKGEKKIHGDLIFFSFQKLRRQNSKYQIKSKEKKE